LRGHLAALRRFALNTRRASAVHWPTIKRLPSTN
jgi:hypothetical protein